MCFTGKKLPKMKPYVNTAKYVGEVRTGNAAMYYDFQIDFSKLRYTFSPLPILKETILMLKTLTHESFRNC